MIEWNQCDPDRHPGENHCHGVVYDPPSIKFHQMLVADEDIADPSGAEARN
jgi:hypothetical protein